MQFSSESIVTKEKNLEVELIKVPASSRRISFVKSIIFDQFTFALEKAQ
jgi:hypothetical protein